MQLDVRQPMGFLFLLLGVVLIVFGFASDPGIYARHSLGINVNLIWGVVFSIFGTVMLYLVHRSRRG